MDTAPSAGRRLLCRLNLWHRWHSYSSSDGGRYVACRYCKKEGPSGNSHWLAGGA